MAFTASVLPKLMLRATDVWQENATRSDSMAKVAIMRAILENQTAQITPIIQGNKDRDVDITWINFCAPSIGDFDNHCTWPSDEPATDSQTYALSINKKTGFRVPIDDFRNNEYGYLDMVARSIIMADKAMCEHIAQTAVAKIETFLGVNTYDNEGSWTINSTDTEIPANQWNSDLFIKLQIAAEKNRMSAPFMISGENLAVDYRKAMLYNANDDGKGNAAAYMQYPIYFDVVNVDAVNAPAYKTYMIDRGAIAFASKTYFGNVPEQIQGEAARQRFSIPSNFIPGLRHDVEVTTQCITNKVYELYAVSCKFDFFQNPVGCTATRTGVYGFTRTAGI